MKALSPLLALLFLFAIQHSLGASSEWHSELAKMPLKTNTTLLTRTNTVPLLLQSLTKNEKINALIFMPGATDELYFFNRVKAWLTNDSPTLLDAVAALTNQTFIEATFRPPFLLLHTREDPLEPSIRIEDDRTAARIRQKRFQKHIFANDLDWNLLQPTLEFYAETKVVPEKGSPDSNHFFRHSFAAWNLTAWESLEAASLAGKTIFTVQKRKVQFQPDPRIREKAVAPERLD